MSIYSPADILPLINGLPFTMSDAVVQSLISAVEAQITQITGLVLAEQTITEWCSGNWNPNLILRNYPIRSVTDVVIWPITNDNPNMAGQNPNPNASPLAETPGVDYFVKFDKWLTDGTELCMAGIVYRPKLWEGQFQRQRGRLQWRKIPGPANIEIEYEAGFPTGQVPDEFLICVAAGVKAAAIMLEQGGRLGTSQSLDGWSESWEATGGRVNPPVPGLAGIIGSTFGMIASWLRPRLLG